MPEIGEIVASPYVHDEEDENCPFCPIDDPEQFTTYPGEKNDSKILSEVMQQPSKLESKQSNIRPKNGESMRQRTAVPKMKPSFSTDGYDYSFQAHHAISGNQAMKYHPIEDWICASNGLIQKDTGYSINNSDNGVWLPSKPTNLNVEWGPLEFDTKLSIATQAMAKGQFHLGPHDITDPEDLFGEYHRSYIDELKRWLDDLYDLIMGWAQCCFLCEDVDRVNGPFNPNWKVHDMLDRLSTAIAVELTMPANTWEYFISKIALEYHKNPGICEHREFE
jgi:hypothetical protein